MGFQKIDVEVTVKFSKRGGMTPLFIRWEDGRLIYIDKVLAVERAPARIPPLLPVRYTCTIMGKKRWLYFEPDIMRWFVEVQE